MFGDLFSSKSKTTSTTNQTAYNQQVAAESGLAFGGAGNVSTVSIQTADPAIVATALGANAVTTRDALATVGGVAQDALDTQRFVSLGAMDVAQKTAGLAIMANTDLAKSYSSYVLESQGKSTNLLQSVSDSLFAAQSELRGLTASGLDQAYDVARAAAPVSEGYLAEQFTGAGIKVAYVIAAIIGIVALVFVLKKR